MKDEIIEEIMRECNISKRKVEEMLKVSLFYGDTYKEAKESIKEFYKKLHSNCIQKSSKR